MLLGIVLLYFCLTFLIPKWQTLRLSDRVASLGPGWLAAAFALTLLQYLVVS